MQAGHLNIFLYHRLRLCEDDPRLLDQWCLTIMRQTKLGDVVPHRRKRDTIRLEGKPGVKEVLLYPNFKPDGRWEIVLALNPGNTMCQARAVYESVQVDRIAALQDSGWSVSPDFHFAFSSSNLCKAKAKGHLSAQQYIQYWQDRVRQRQLRQIPRSDWDKWFAEWQAKGVMSTSEVENIREFVMSRAYSSLNVCPGLTFSYTWDGELAVAIDDQADTAFAEELATKIADATAAW
jgi:hypothetical protein